MANEHWQRPNNNKTRNDHIGKPSYDGVMPTPDHKPFSKDDTEQGNQLDTKTSTKDKVTSTIKNTPKIMKHAAKQVAKKAAKQSIIKALQACVASVICGVCLAVAIIIIVVVAFIFALTSASVQTERSPGEILAAQAEDLAAVENGRAQIYNRALPRLYNFKVHPNLLGIHRAHCDALDNDGRWDCDGFGFAHVGAVVEMLGGRPVRVFVGDNPRDIKTWNETTGWKDVWENIEICTVNEDGNRSCKTERVLLGWEWQGDTTGNNNDDVCKRLETIISKEEDKWRKLPSWTDPGVIYTKWRLRKFENVKLLESGNLVDIDEDTYIGIDLDLTKNWGEDKQSFTGPLSGDQFEGYKFAQGRLEACHEILAALAVWTYADRQARLLVENDYNDGEWNADVLRLDEDGDGELDGEGMLDPVLARYGLEYLSDAGSGDDSFANRLSDDDSDTLTWTQRGFQLAALGAALRDTSDGGLLLGVYGQPLSDPHIVENPRPQFVSTDTVSTTSSGADTLISDTYKKHASYGSFLDLNGYILCPTPDLRDSPVAERSQKFGEAAKKLSSIGEETVSEFDDLVEWPEKVTILRFYECPHIWDCGNTISGEALMREDWIKSRSALSFDEWEKGVFDSGILDVLTTMPSEIRLARANTESDGCAYDEDGWGVHSSDTVELDAVTDVGGRPHHPVLAPFSATHNNGLWGVGLGTYASNEFMVAAAALMEMGGSQSIWPLDSADTSNGGYARAIRRRLLSTRSLLTSPESGSAAIRVKLGGVAVTESEDHVDWRCGHVLSSYDGEPVNRCQYHHWLLSTASSRLSSLTQDSRPVENGVFLAEVLGDGSDFRDGIRRWSDHTDGWSYSDTCLAMIRAINPDGKCNAPSWDEDSESELLSVLGWGDMTVFAPYALPLPPPALLYENNNLDTTTTNIWEPTSYSFMRYTDSANMLRSVNYGGDCANVLNAIYNAELTTSAEVAEDVRKAAAESGYERYVIYKHEVGGWRYSDDLIANYLDTVNIGGVKVSIHSCATGRLQQLSNSYNLSYEGSVFKILPGKAVSIGDKTVFDGGAYRSVETQRTIRIARINSTSCGYEPEYKPQAIASFEDLSNNEKAWIDNAPSSCFNPLVGKPGESKHNGGVAIDIDRASMGATISSGNEGIISVNERMLLLTGFPNEEECRNRSFGCWKAPAGYNPTTWRPPSGGNNRSWEPWHWEPW